MIYQLTKKGHTYLEITRLYKTCVILPINFGYKKSFPRYSLSTTTYKRIINIQFCWLFWRYDLLIRKPR